MFYALNDHGASDRVRRDLYIAVLKIDEQTTRVYGPADEGGGPLECWSADAITFKNGYLQTTSQAFIDPSDGSVMSNNTLRDEFERHYRSILDHLRYRDETYYKGFREDYSENDHRDEVDSFWTITVGDRRSSLAISRAVNEGRKALQQHTGTS